MRETTIPQVSLEAAQLVPTVARPRRVATFLFVVFLLFTCVALVAPWQQSVRGSGRVISYAPLERRQPVQAPIGGRVQRFFVHEGSRVKAGDPLLELSDNDPRLMERLDEQRDALQLKLDSYEDRVKQLQGQIESLRLARTGAVEGADAKRAGSVQKLTAAEQKLSAAEAALQTALLQAQRVEALAAEGLSSTREVELAQLSLTKARTERDSVAASVTGARADVAAAGADVAKTRSDTEAKVQEVLSKLGSARSDVADTRASLSRIRVKIARQEQQLVRAPRDGVVLRLLTAQGGALVKPGEPLLELVPDASARAVEVWVDGNDASLIDEGRPVRLQFEGWPAVQFTGWPSVAVGTFGGRVAFVDAHGDGKGSFRLVVTPDPDDEDWPNTRYLRQGVRVKGWILLRQVSVGYELWRQFNGFPPVVDPPGSDPGMMTAKGDK